jgi:hypothetical protein
LSDIRLNVVLILILDKCRVRRTRTNSHRSWRCFSHGTSHSGTLPSSNEEGMLRPPASAGVVRLSRWPCFVAQLELFASWWLVVFGHRKPTLMRSGSALLSYALIKIT